MTCVEDWQLVKVLFTSTNHIFSDSNIENNHIFSDTNIEKKPKSDKFLKEKN